MIDHPVPQTARLGIRGLLLMALIALVALPMGCNKSPAPFANTTNGDAMMDAVRGGKLTADEIRELETKVAGNPEDISSRNQLLGSYMTAQSKSKEAREARQKHILWLIEHHPEAGILKSPYGGLNKILDGSAYEQAKTLWLDQVKKNPKQAAILGHAANFCLLQDRPIAEDLLKKAQALEPTNPEWPAKLAQLYGLNASNPKLGGPGNEDGKKALEQMENAQANTKEASTKFSNLDSLAKMAFRAGDTAKAKSYATEYLKQAEENKSSWAYGNAVHNGNAVLGRIALREGKLDEAKKHLLAAGATKGSPQLNSFGPNMALAKELIEKGEKETVLEYLKLCGNFWTMGADKLNRWSKDIKDGLTPEFAGNLNY
jgi:hypothetical protein